MYEHGSYCSGLFGSSPTGFLLVAAVAYFSFPYLYKSTILQAIIHSDTPILTCSSHYDVKYFISDTSQSEIKLV